MLKTHEKFHSSNGKRQVLIVDDEQINRELLAMVLSEDFEPMQAEDGESALKVIRENSDTLSLILLDLLMPGMHDLDVIKVLKNDQDLKDIPIIVLTADQEAEVSSLQLGASDFIPKPYPKNEVILTRVMRAIELSEDRDIIQSTERDTLTGLYNREYFYRYAEQFDHHHKGMDMDAIVIDVFHFRMINERYGKAYGDAVLTRIGERVREMVRDSGGIVCRREADTFLVYCPHRDDYKEILENASEGLAGDSASQNRVRLRMGIYAHVDKEIEMERRFDRAKMALDTVRQNFLKGYAFYDNKIHESEIYAEQLLEDFHEAIQNKELTVFYQPKFDIRPDIPVLASAEALVRWRHPKLGMINPAVFIPLFEENGLIQQLDHYVWEEAASQIKEWKEKFGISIPVSVNVSRIDMYDPKLIDFLCELMEKYGLSPEDMFLEITESAYTQDSDQIISTVNRMREIGFRIEMDDFGTGYSSLSMISSLPIDALKLDMHFIRNAFKGGKDARLIEVIIDIADYLGVPVIAEGVETEEQLIALKKMGCDIVQGYYFSKPVPPEEYELFVEKRAEDDGSNSIIIRTKNMPDDKIVRPGVAHALSSGFEVIYYVNSETGHYVEFSSQGRYEDLHIDRSGVDFFEDTQRNIPKVVYKDDIDRVSLSMKKDALLAQLMGGRSFSMTYRLVIGGEPVYYNLCAVNAGVRDDYHIVIGINNVSDQLQKANSSEIAGNLEILAIAHALSSDFESIYYVDLETEEYTEFIAQGSYEALHIELSGSEFFSECQKNLLEVVYDQDRSLMSKVLDKETLLEVLSEEPSFSVTYRLVIEGVPVWYQLKAVIAEDSRHLVIGVSNAEKRFTHDVGRGITYAKIAQALARDYFSIFYVDLTTGSYTEFSSQQETQTLKMLREGDDFFGDAVKIITDNIPEDERKYAYAAFSKHNLLKDTEDGRVFSFNFLINTADGILNAGLKASRLPGDEEHMVIGIRNIEDQLAMREEIEKAKEESVTFSSIAQALSADYFAIYYVDTETDRFKEFSSDEDYETLGIEKSGEDFFNLSRKNIVRVIHPDDLEKFLEVFTKENLLEELRKNGKFTLNYRLMFADTPTYVSMKATYIRSKDKKHIVIGINNIDAQMRRENELNAAREMANRDALTGVKSKHAYDEAVFAINSLIGAGENVPFAVAVCDVNGLKQVNDTKGHQAGDKLILDATRIICETFKHSPVFRIGGDEFVAILKGSDYENRNQLISNMAESNKVRADNGEVTVACGSSDWNADARESYEDVFARADEEMYRNKDKLKIQ
ncbi:MAG: EAL domain-containing protein [Oscillospiraceae bacterium]|nr:EAL domain-containing protein [Oscillospiraceae bacterium]